MRTEAERERIKLSAACLNGIVLVGGLSIPTTIALNAASGGIWPAAGVCVFCFFRQPGPAFQGKENAEGTRPITILETLVVLLITPASALLISAWVLHENRKTGIASRKTEKARLSSQA